MIRVVETRAQTTSAVSGFPEVLRASKRTANRYRHWTPRLHSRGRASMLGIGEREIAPYSRCSLRRNHRRRKSWPAPGHASLRRYSALFIAICIASVTAVTLAKKTSNRGSRRGDVPTLPPRPLRYDAATKLRDPSLFSARSAVRGTRLSEHFATDFVRALRAPSDRQ